MSDNETKTNPIAKNLVALTDKLQSVKGGRFILALATGALNVVPVSAAVGSGVLEYRNLYASAAVDKRIARLAERIDELSKALNENVKQLDLLYEMIEDISVRLQDYIEPQAIDKILDLDVIVGSLLNPTPAQPWIDVGESNKLDALLKEKNYKVLLLRLDAAPQLPTEQERLLRTKALYGLGKFEDLYVLLKKEPVTGLLQEELEDYIWACFHIGYTIDGIQAIRYYETNFHSVTSHLFLSSVKTRYFRKTSGFEKTKGQL